QEGFFDCASRPGDRKDRSPGKEKASGRSAQNDNVGRAKRLLGIFQPSWNFTVARGAGLRTRCRCERAAVLVGASATEVGPKPRRTPASGPRIAGSQAG